MPQKIDQQRLTALETENKLLKQENGTEVLGLIKVADDAIYEVKKSGKINFWYASSATEYTKSTGTREKFQAEQNNKLPWSPFLSGTHFSAKPKKAAHSERLFIYTLLM